MGVERFSLANIFSAHWKGLTKPPEGGEPPRPDVCARLILVIGSPLAGVVVFGLGVSLSSPAIIVAALSLMTGAMLTLFTQLSTLRLKLTEWYDDDDIEHRANKDSIDESVAHVLMAALLCITATAFAVAAVVVDGTTVPVVKGVVAAITVALIAYILLLLIMLLPRLYSAYVAVHDVSDTLNGQISDRTGKTMRRM